MDCKGQYCRLCLNVVSTDNFEEVDDPMKNVFDVLFLSLNFSDDCRYALCTPCSQQAMGAYSFKLQCLSTNSTVTPYVNYKPLENRKLCCLCLKIIRGAFTSLFEINTDLIQKYIPEIKFDTIKDVMCQDCVSSFNTHTSFIKSCLEKREMDESFHDVKVNSGTLCDVPANLVIKSEAIDTELEGIEQVLIKTEPTETKDEAEEMPVKMEHVDIKVEESISSTESPPQELDGLCSCKVKKKSIIRHDVVQRIMSKIKIYACDYCDFKTMDQSQIQQHVSTHQATETVYKCTLCDFTTDADHKLQAHQLEHEIETYKCDTCDYETSYRKSFTIHQRRHEDDTKKYKCDQCDFKTKYKGYLSSHSLTHTDSSQVTTYKCGICDFTTKFRGKLKYHQTKHAPPSQVRMYRCEACPFSSKSERCYNVHKLRHADSSELEMYKCDICDFQTKYKYSIKLHEKHHMDPAEVPMHKCELCDFESKHKYSLKCHMLRHAEPSTVQKYECDLCNYRTKFKHSLQKHKQAHQTASERQTVK